MVPAAVRGEKSLIFKAGGREKLGNMKEVSGKKRGRRYLRIKYVLFILGT